MMMVVDERMIFCLLDVNEGDINSQELITIFL